MKKIIITLVVAIILSSCMFDVPWYVRAGISPMSFESKTAELTDEYGSASEIYKTENKAAFVYDDYIIVAYSQEGYGWSEHKLIEDQTVAEVVVNL